MVRPYKKKNMKKIFTTYGKLCKLPLGWSLWGLLFFLIFAIACTNDVAEVNTSQQQEQYVTVRMNVPGMQTSISRAAEDNITSITALSYDSNNKLTKKVSATNLNTENRTFNITVPNGTKNIHFLANNTVSLPEIGTDVSALTSLTTSDYNNLVYWGMATTSDGNTNPLSVTLYRNLAKISIKPSEAADAFNDYTQEQLIIMGLMNANRNGKLIPYNDGSFYSNQNGTAPDYLTLPDNPNPLDKTPVGNNGAGYGYSLYVLEHDNPKDWDTGLYVICEIGGAYYKVALVGEDGEPYDIIRNHEYIIYVSDVDDYAYDTDYRAEIYSDAFDKKPINLDVEEVVLQNVTFTYTNKTLYLKDSSGNSAPTSLDVTVNVPYGYSLSQLNITANGFTIKQNSNTVGTDTYNGYTGGTTTFTFTPTSTESKTITFSGSGSYLMVPDTTINVTIEEKMPAAGDEVVIWDSTKNPEITNLPEGYILLSVGRNGTGSADSFDSYFKAGATLYIEFKCNINESWQQPNLTLRTSWSTTFTTLTYTEGDMECSDVHQMSYTFKEDDISGNVDDGNITNAGLQLNGSYLDITKIYIIPASTP